MYKIAEILIPNVMSVMDNRDRELIHEYHFIIYSSHRLSCNIAESYSILEEYL